MGEIRSIQARLPERLALVYWYTVIQRLVDVEDMELSEEDQHWMEKIRVRCLMAVELYTLPRPNKPQRWGRLTDQTFFAPP
jgi:hypothetical protein